MKATGIVRKIDDLGRIVIPKEIRKSLHIHEGDPLEIFLQTKGEIILKKYAPMGDMIDLATKYAETIYEETSFPVCITDSETVIAISGVSKNEYITKEVSDEILHIMKERRNFVAFDRPTIPILLNEQSNKYSSEIILPIISNADVLGTVILFSHNDKRLTLNEEKLAKSIVKLLTKQLD